MVIKTKTKLGELGEQIGTANYLLGQIVGYETISRKLSSKAGKAYMDGNDKLALMYRNLAQEILEWSHEERKIYNSEWRKKREDALRIERNSGMVSEVRAKLLLRYANDMKRIAEREEKERSSRVDLIRNLTEISRALARLPLVANINNDRKAEAMDQAINNIIEQIDKLIGSIEEKEDDR